MAVDQDYAAALKAECSTYERPVPGPVDWGDRGRLVSGVSPLATAAGAAAEGARVAAFFAQPLARDKVMVLGEARAWRGRCIQLVAGSLDYASAGELVFVLAVAEQENGTSILTVLKRLS